jgi:hypothetical protein
VTPAPLAVALAAVAALMTPAAAAADRQSRLLPLPATRTLSLELTIASLKIEGWARAEASIEIVRHAPSADALARMPIEFDESETHVRVSAVQTDGGTDPALCTEVTLRVPREARLTLVRVLEGEIAVNGLHGGIDASIQRGAITATDVSGAVRLESGIGNVIADRALLSSDGVLRLRSFNGDVRLSLVQRPTDARVMALALNGTIASDIPLTMKDSWGPMFGEATLGKGHPVISIDVVTGKIELKSP